MKTNDIAVSTVDLSKSFKLPREQHSGIKQMIVNFFHHPTKRVRGYEIQEVLHDISFDVHKGEFFGIVGKNGSGKSTLLKLLAGIYSPDKGSVHVEGSLAPFIELGVGFNPELTGRENVYLNSALLGFSKLETDDMYDEIVEFAELSKFMDQKLKNYSSGMQVRLAFSIAIRARSDVLLIDEVLAVGDSAFQEKCFDYFENIKKQKKTIILVTHDMGSVEKFCDRAILIDKGRIKTVGDPYDVASNYSMLNQRSVASENEASLGTELGGVARIKKSSINTPETAINRNRTVEIDVTGDIKAADDIVIGVSIIRRDNVYIAGQNTSLETFHIKKGTFKIRCELDISKLMTGSYFINVSLYTRDFKLLDFASSVAGFNLKGKTKNKDGIIDLPVRWEYENR